VIFHTGWISLIGKDDKRYSAGDPPPASKAPNILTGRAVVAIGADTWALEVIPFESKNVFEVHQILLPMNGTYHSGESWIPPSSPKDKAMSSCLSLGQHASARCAEHDQPGRDPRRPAFEGWRGVPAWTPRR